MKMQKKKKGEIDEIFRGGTFHQNKSSIQHLLHDIPILLTHAFSSCTASLFFLYLLVDLLKPVKDSRLRFVKCLLRFL